MTLISSKPNSVSHACVLFMYVLLLMVKRIELISNRYESMNSFDLTDGKRSYESALMDSKIPKFGTCWKNALVKLNAYCKQLSDDKQHRLALYFTNCFLKKIGSTDYSDCENNSDLSSCTSKMKDSDRGIYSNFFTHAHNMCGFLQMSVWHELTEQTISNLAHSSENVAEKLSESAQVQQDIIEKQLESLKNQEGIIVSGEKLNEAIRSSSQNVHKMFDDFKQTTQEQRLVISEIFDRVTSLQSIVLGEFTGFYSLIFYAMSVVISYLLTSTPRTSAARFWMFIVATADIICERLIVSYINASQSANVNDVNEDLYRKLWLCRKLYCVLALSVLLFVAYNFKDINAVNNRLLLEIKEEISVMKRDRYSLDSVTDGELSIKPAQIGQGDQWMPVEVGRNYGRSNICNNINDSSSSDDSDLDESFKLFSVSDDEEYSDSESTCSYRTDFSSTTLLFEELQELRESTPIREIEREKRRQKKQYWSDGSSNHHYNLRRRSNDQPNPMIFSETPRRFAKAVKSLAKRAIRNQFELSNNTYTVEQTFVSTKD